MFSKKRKQQPAKAPEPPPPTYTPPPPPQLQQDAAQVPPRIDSMAAQLQMTFDFELPRSASRSTLGEDRRPQTSDGVMGARQRPAISRGTSTASGKSAKSSPRPGTSREASSTRPVISREASSTRPAISREVSSQSLSRPAPLSREISREDIPLPPPRLPRLDSDNASASSAASRRKSRIKSFFGLDASPSVPEPLPVPLPRPATSGNNSTESFSRQMSPSLFPTRQSSTPALPTLSTHNTPPMTRAQIDALDKPYTASTPTKRPALPSSLSTPDLSLHSSQTNPIKRSPLAPASPVATTFTRPNTSRQNTLEDLGPVPPITLGTPYNATSPAFPPPRQVATRPKTPSSATSAKLNGIPIPTHHTTSAASKTPSVSKSTSTSKSPDPAKPDASRRKSRLLTLLSSRRGRAAEAAAIERQRSVLAHGGVVPSASNSVYGPLPDDYDPRIVGRGVHDFSAPRTTAPTTAGPKPPRLTFVGQTLSGGRGSPGPVSPSWHSPSDSGSTGRRATGFFQEHLGEGFENQGSLNKGNSPRNVSRIQAERLENKEFLKRASYLSQAGSGESGESAVLPPFARPSGHRTSAVSQNSSQLGRGEQYVDPHIDTARARDSGVSSLEGGSTGMSVDSPVSPASDARRNHFMSGFSARSGSAAGAVSRLGSSRETSTTPSPAISPPAVSDPADPIASVGGTTMRPPISITIPVPAAPSRLPPEVPPRGTSATLYSPSLASPPHPNSHTSPISPLPEPQIADAVQMVQPKQGKRIVERRKDAVGHSSRGANGNNIGIPRHNVSNASRFSFQFGGSAAEEMALEEKAREGRGGKGAGGAFGDEDDDEDFFDEDAMDDEDEMERDGVYGMEYTPPVDRGTAPAVQQNAGRPATASVAGAGHSQMSTLELQIQHDDSGESEYEEDEEAPYWMHEDFLGYEEDQSRKTSVGEEFAAMSGATTGTRLSKTGLYMHPQATAGNATLGSSRNSRITSGLNATADNADNASPKPRHTPAMSSSTTGGSSSSEPRTLSTGLGLSGFSDFKFSESAPPSRPPSQQVDVKENRRTRDSETIPTEINWSNKESPAVVKSEWLDGHAPAAVATSPAINYDQDMYFDDGSFEADVNAPLPPSSQTESHTIVDEDAFDDPTFLSRSSQPIPTTIQPTQPQHTRVSSLGPDGPYPPFATPNAPRARQRDSQFLLEDLPLHAVQDTNLIPMRNPSEDTKRMGRSSRVPPLPAQAGSQEAAIRAQRGLSEYHKALADAVEGAARQGRFERSVSGRSAGASLSVRRSMKGSISGVSGSEYSQGSGNVSRDEIVAEERDVAEDGDEAETKLPDLDFGGDGGLMFDFGFGGTGTATDSQPRSAQTDTFSADAYAHAYSTTLDDTYPSFPSNFPSDNDTYVPMDDGAYSPLPDDYVAAANADLLASDDAAFYGSEFGFYAKAARGNMNMHGNGGGPSAAEISAINGGYFGPDGDDGLTRNRSVKEPNLTPITERSEFSTRNSFIGPLSATSLNSSAGPWGRGQVLGTLADGEVATFEELRALRRKAFGGSEASLSGSEGRGSVGSFERVGGQMGGTMAAAAESPTGSLRDELPSSPTTTTTGDWDATPKRPSHDSGTIGGGSSPITARKLSFPMPPSSSGPMGLGVAGGRGHSRNSSGADSVGYVREEDPEGGGSVRWVMERRRMSEVGKVEVVAREVVKGGWI